MFNPILKEFPGVQTCRSSEDNSGAAPLALCQGWYETARQEKTYWYLSSFFICICICLYLYLSVFICLFVCTVFVLFVFGHAPRAICQGWYKITRQNKTLSIGSFSFYSICTVVVFSFLFLFVCNLFLILSLSLSRQICLSKFSSSLSYLAFLYSRT